MIKKFQNLYRYIENHLFYLNNNSYLKYLKKFITDNDIKSIIDIGCGDWKLYDNFLIDKNIKYLGIDNDKTIISKNLETYTYSNIKFMCKSILEYENLPKSDLCIVKNVLEYMEIEDIKNLIEKLKKSEIKYILIVTDYSRINTNLDVKKNIYRPIDLSKSPFEFDFKIEKKFFEILPILKYILFLLIILYLSKRKKYKLYIFVCLCTIIYGFLILPRKKIQIIRNIN